MKVLVLDKEKGILDWSDLERTPVVSLRSCGSRFQLKPTLVGGVTH